VRRLHTILTAALPETLTFVAQLDRVSSGGPGCGARGWGGALRISWRPFRWSGVRRRACCWQPGRTPCA
jgi:hypothetical protein